MPPYHSLSELLLMIEEPHQADCQRLWRENQDLSQAAYGGKSKHQAWRGGYIDHLTETMNIAVLLYEPLHLQRTLPFSLSDALMVLFLHDIDKLWRYVEKEGKLIERPEMDSKGKRDVFAAEKIKEHGFTLSPTHQNALQYVEGEGDDYHSHERRQQPLAAFVHVCDTLSARVWFDYPRENDDPWEGAGRKKI